MQIIKYCHLLLVSLLFLNITGCQKQPPVQSPQVPPEVDVALPLKQKIVEWDEYTGRFEAIESVDIRARVTGYLVEKKFKDGQTVKKGDVLFVIDPRPFEFQVQRAEAQFQLARKEYNRAINLRKTNAVSSEEVDRRLNEFKVAEAELNSVKLDLAFTQVKSPIDGKLSEDFINVGNLVRENDTVLTRVVSFDPIHFEFEASQAQLLKYIRLDRAGKRPGSDTNPNPIFIRLQDELTYEHQGYMDFVDNIIDRGTGTILGKAVVSNQDSVIYPGLFGRARLLGSGEYEAILLPEKAINTEQTRKFVYTLTTENQAQRTYIELGPLLDNGMMVIKKGLMGDERVVISGSQRIRMPQQPVTPKIIELKWVEVDTMMTKVSEILSKKQGGDKSTDSSTQTPDIQP
ncbi:MAG: efflux RND transporter periplasmic adaptor subunit [Pseudomonadota bacterium]